MQVFLFWFDNNVTPLSLSEFDTQLSQCDRGMTSGIFLSFFQKVPEQRIQHELTTDKCQAHKTRTLN
jgi:hypothetical protein